MARLSLLVQQLLTMLRDAEHPLDILTIMRLLRQSNRFTPPESQVRGALDHNTELFYRPFLAERRSEWSKAMMRLFIVVVLFVVVVYLNSRGQPLMSKGTLALLAGVSGFVALAFIAWLAWARYHPAFKFVTAAADVALISLLVHVTGAHRSVFYSLYFIVLISNGVRYGAAMSAFVALAFNVAYVLVLAQRPQQAIPLQHEGVKILAFWLAAFYVGYLAARFQRLQREVDGYVETIARLREELENARKGTQQ